jgi:hypothetical protein
MRHARFTSSAPLLLFIAVTSFLLLCGAWGQVAMANNDYSGPTKCEMLGAAASVPLLIGLLIGRRSIYFRLAVLTVIVIACLIFDDGYTRYCAIPR